MQTYSQIKRKGYKWNYSKSKEITSLEEITNWGQFLYNMNLELIHVPHWSYFIFYQCKQSKTKTNKKKTKDRKSVWILNCFDLCLYLINYYMNLCELLWNQTQLWSIRLHAQIIPNQIFHSVVDVLNNTQKLVIRTFLHIILPCCNQFKYSPSHKLQSSLPQNAFKIRTANIHLI